MQAPFDRSNIGVRERATSGDLNRAESQLDRTIRDLMLTLMSGRSITSRAAVPYSGFIGDGFRVVPTSPVGLSVQVLPGFGFVHDPVDLPVDIGAPDFASIDDRSAFKPVFLLAPAVFAVPAAPPAGQSRIDIIEVRADRRLEDPQTRRQLASGSNTFFDHVFNKTLAWGLDGRVGMVDNPNPSTAGLSYKIGAPAVTGTEVEPSTTAGYVKIGRISVGPTVTTIDNDVLVDRRPLLHDGGVVPFSARWRLQWNGGSPIVTALAMAAPPGVQLSMGATAARGAGIIYVLGGEILRATLDIRVFKSLVQPNPDRFVLGFQEGEGIGGAIVLQVSAAAQTDLATNSTPAVSVGIGTPYARERFFSRFVTATGTSNNTDASLEDMIVNVSGGLQYV